MALGYIYGFADCALRIAKLDVASEYGNDLLFFSFQNSMNQTSIGSTTIAGRLHQGQADGGRDAWRQ
jgi:hypothetical protein